MASLFSRPLQDVLKARGEQVGPTPQCRPHARCQGGQLCWQALLQHKLAWSRLPMARTCRNLPRAGALLSSPESKSTEMSPALATACTLASFSERSLRVLAPPTTEN